MAIESKDLLVAIKAYSRNSALPLDASEVHDSLEAAQSYAATPTAYAGQTIKALVNGEYVSYVLQPDGGNSLTLQKVGIDTSEVKNYVQVVDALPVTGQEQGVVYIDTTADKGYIWNGSVWKQIFEQVDGLGTTIEDHSSRLTEIEGKLEALQGTGEGSVEKALEDAKAYSDAVKGELQTSIDAKANASDVYTKEQADSAISQAISEAGHLSRVILTGTLEEVESPDDKTIYMLPIAGAPEDGNQHYEEYMYINGKFEKIGDTKVDLTDYATKAYVDGKSADYATSAQGALADSALQKADVVTGTSQGTISVKGEDVAVKGLGNAAYATVESLNETAQGYADAAKEGAISSVTETLKSYVTSEAFNAKVGDITSGTIAEEIENAKQSAITTAQNALDGQVSIINSTLDTKITADYVDSKLGTLPGDKTLVDYVDDRVGEIPSDKTIKEYVDGVVESGGVDQSAAIEKAKQEAIAQSKEYTESRLTIVEF